ncbi:MAG: transposase [Symploca sp. SIO2B6]|nr:transposase [Symploca sp. SIO2B6]
MNTAILGRLVKCHPDITLAVELAQSFLRLLRDQQPEQFDSWLKTVLSSSLNHFQSFANGLMEDYAAVKARMMLDASNGPVEGLNNRLKMLKRQMFGRASLELLEKRFILA